MISRIYRSGYDECDTHVPKLVRMTSCIIYNIANSYRLVYTCIVLMCTLAFSTVLHRPLCVMIMLVTCSYKLADTQVCKRHFDPVWNMADGLMCMFY